MALNRINVEYLSLKTSIFCIFRPVLAYFEVFLMDTDLQFGVIWNPGEFPTQKTPILLVCMDETWQKSKMQIFSFKIGIFAFLEQSLPIVWYFY